MSSKIYIKNSTLGWTGLPSTLGSAPALTSLFVKKLFNMSQSKVRSHAQNLHTNTSNINAPVFLGKYTLSEFIYGYQWASEIIQ